MKPLDISSRGSMTVQRVTQRQKEQWTQEVIRLCEASMWCPTRRDLERRWRAGWFPITAARLILAPRKGKIAERLEKVRIARGECDMSKSLLDKVNMVLRAFNQPLATWAEIMPWIDLPSQEIARRVGRARDDRG
jgi:hypothetical protein